jgi:hypothetical protein
MPPPQPLQLIIELAVEWTKLYKQQQRQQQITHKQVTAIEISPLREERNERYSYVSDLIDCRIDNQR